MSRREFRSQMQRGRDRLVVAPLALDALSAALAKRTGFDAVYLGGGGLGYARGVTEALLTATEVAEATRAITELVDISVVVDGGIGFGDAVHMARTIRLVEQAGACAIEIEDQVAPKRVHHHKGVEHLVSAEEMAGKIRAAAEARTDSDFVIIVRCNAIGHEGIERALERAAAYTEAGADMLMLFSRSDDHLQAISSRTSLPLAAMSIGAGRSEQELCAAGYALAVDPMSATVLGYQALKRGYEGIKSEAGIGMSREEILDTIAEVGKTIGIDQLYEIEAQTTERALYEAKH
jgi:2-methylisocitrate lyase-like PEP mutase family enzyme